MLISLIVLIISMVSFLIIQSISTLLIFGMGLLVYLLSTIMMASQFLFIKKLNELGCYIIEYQIINKKIVKVLQIHLSNRKGMKKLKTIQTKRGKTIYCLSEFIDLCKAIQLNGNLDFDYLEGISTIITPRICEKIKIPRAEYKAKLFFIMFRLNQILNHLILGNKLDNYNRGLGQILLSKNEFLALDLSEMEKYKNRLENKNGRTS